MTSSLTIDRLRARYRLPKSAGQSARSRLDALLTEVATNAFERDAWLTGIAQREEICVRSVTASTRLRLSAPDGALTQTWSETIAQAIRAAIERGGPRVARYSSREHAIVDVAVGVAADDLQRAWAWRQLGLWSAVEHPGSATAADELYRVLRSTPFLVVPVLRALADHGRLPQLVQRLTSGHWTGLAQAALTAAGAVPSLTHQAPRGAPRPATVRAAEFAAVIRSESRLAEVAADTPLDPATRTAFAILAIAEAEPLALRGRGAATLLAAVEATLSAGVPRAREDPTTIPEREGDGGSEGARATDHKRRRASRGSRTTRGRAGQDDGESTQDGRESTLTTARSADGPQARHARQPAQQPEPLQLLEESTPPPDRDTGSVRTDVAGEQSDAPPPTIVDPQPEVPERPLPNVRSDGATAYGGLLFLINVVRDAGIDGRLAATRGLKGRPFRWRLHRLALALAPLQPADPAALAFAGLSPDDEPPTVRGPRITAGESRAIRRLALRVRRALHDRLGLAHLTPPDLLELVCRHRAEVVADPGWIEVRFSIDDVDIDIRRAGLDLDPGYVPWLGIVLRFVYE